MATPRVESNGSVYNGVNVKTPYANETDQGVKVEDFLNLMVAQLSNQDPMNPVDDTQYVTQMAQFATMQSMQELSHYSQNSYVAGLVGKSVTVANLGIGGSVSSDTGIVSGVNISAEGYTLTVNGRQYELSQVMSIVDPTRSVTKEDMSAANKMPVVVTQTARDGFKVRWDAPKEIAEGEVTYSVYYTQNDEADMSTLNGVKKGTLAGSGLASPQFDVSGLEANAEYTVNVVVRNKAGEEAIYQSVKVHTNA